MQGPFFSQKIDTRCITGSRHYNKSGQCRELFEAWCEDPKNGVIIADFAVAGTLAREVLDEPKEVMSHSGHKVTAMTLLLTSGLDGLYHRYTRSCRIHTVKS